jgi:hypothetical protein
MLGKSVTSIYLRKCLDDDPNMDRNMQQALSKSNVSTVILNWFFENCFVDGKKAHCDTQQNADNKDEIRKFIICVLCQILLL